MTDSPGFTDPDGHGIEVYYGQHRESTPFVSPTGARFVTEGMGIGHVMFAVSESAPFRELYMDILGLGLSDYIDIGPDPGTFLHCNPRHHSVAFAHRPGFGPRLGHLMVQVDNLDTVGRAYDRILEGAAPLGATLGKHTNDEMISYYVKTPSGWEMEYGYGGLEIDEDTWFPAGGTPPTSGDISASADRPSRARPARTGRRCRTVAPRDDPYPRTRHTLLLTT